MGVITLVAAEFADMRCLGSANTRHGRVREYGLLALGGVQAVITLVAADFVLVVTTLVAAYFKISRCVCNDSTHRCRQSRRRACRLRDGRHDTHRGRARDYEMCCQ